MRKSHIVIVQLVSILILLLLTTCGSHVKPIEPDEVDGLGDINLNGTAYEIADAVMFSNYFIVGARAFPDGQEDPALAASDVNRDGIVPSVADLVYLIRVITGEANPNVDPLLRPVTANYRYDNGVVNVEGRMGAAAFVFEGEVSVDLLADNMELKVAFDGVNTKAVVYSIRGNTFTGDVVKGNGCISMDLGSADGARVTSHWLPSSYTLSQNYPNPFNPSTTISFQIPRPLNCTFVVKNSSGRVVFRESNPYTAGAHAICFDGSKLAGGVCYYRLTAGDFSDTKKMLLLK